MYWGSKMDKHWQFRIKAPILAMKQLLTYRIGFTVDGTHENGVVTEAVHTFTNPDWVFVKAIKTDVEHPFGCDLDKLGVEYVLMQRPEGEETNGSI
jgi:hypothetical protein